MLPRTRLSLERLRTFFDAGNLFRAVLAIILAFTLWAWVTAEQDPEISRTLLAVPVSAVNIPEELEVVGRLPTVEVRLQGPQSAVQPLEADSIRATVNLEDVEEPGTAEFDVSVRAPEAVRVRDIVPEQVEVTLDQVTVRENVPVETVSPVDLPENYEVNSLTPTPQEVTVRGPMESVDRVAAVRVDVAVNGRSSGFTDVLTPVPVDAAGQPIPDLTVEPQQIIVVVDLEVRGQVRKVIPEVIGTDALAPGYELSRPPTVVPTDEVIIDGPDEEVAKVLYLTTEPIDITGWSNSEVVRDVPLDLSQLPPGVTVDRTTVHVSIQIRRETFRKEISGIPVQLVNLRPGTSASTNPATAAVVLEGSRTVLESLTAEDVSLVIDVGSAGPGNYRRQPRLILPAGVQYQEIAPSEMVVTITEAGPSASPIATVTPSPTPRP